MSATLLLVDDHPVFRQGLVHLLSKENDLRVVGEAEDGSIAIDMVEQKKPDIVVMDINMPNLNGIEATRRILSKAPETKVVALSVNSGKQFVRDMIQAGASGYILKESIPEEMIEGIRTVLSGDVYLSKSISKLLVSDYKTLVTESRPEPGKPAEPILYTKLHRPPISAGIIPRTRLLELLENGIENPMMLIAAPAGYGKSILASQWLDVSGSPGAWVSLDERDNELCLFLNYFLEAIQKVFADHELKTKPLLETAKLPSPEMLARYLLNDLETVSERFILVIDDYHVIRNSEVHDFLTELMIHPSSKMHLVLISRRDPPLPLTNLRACRMLTEITSAHLRFSALETKLFLERFLHITISENTGQVLEEKIEGWATGLYLAALSIRDEADQEHLVAGLMETSQYVQEYLIQEVFSRLQPPYDRCLLNTSILDRFCAPLCDVLLSALPKRDQAETYISGQEFIKWLVKRRLFVVPLDASNRWFRYQHLFSEFLKRQMQQGTDAQEIAKLHSRAAEWFESQGFITDSIDHALAAGNVAGAADIIERFRHEEHNRDRWHILERCLTKLTDDILQQRPGLLLAQAWIAFNRFQLEQIPALLAQAEALMDGQPVEPAIQDEMDFFQGNLQYWEGKAENARQCLAKVLSKPFSTMNPHVMFMLGLARCMCGQKDTAIQALEDQIRDAGHSTEGVFISTLIGGRAFIHILSGELHAAGLQAQRLQVAAKKNAVHNHLAWSSYLKAIVHLHVNELVQASDDFESALQQRYHLEPRAALDAFAGLALTQQLMQETESALETTDRLLDFAQGLNDPQFLPLTQSCRARLLLLQGDLAPALQWAGSFNEAPEPSALFLWLEVPLITKARVLIAHGSEENLLKATELLHALRKLAESCRFTCQKIEVMVLQSILFEKMGQTNEAILSLEKVVASAEADSWVRPFIEAGPPMASLIKRLRKESGFTDRIDRILAAFGDNSANVISEITIRPLVPEEKPVRTSTPVEPLIETLTTRELDVLELLAQRLQNKEIADKLFVTTETVKGHLKNIYQKLGVSKRRQAVMKAKQIGLL